MTIYVRHKLGEERRSPPGRFGPLRAEDPLVGHKCLGCFERLVPGDTPTVYALGPERDEAAKADAGGWYSALGFPMHEHCAWGREDWR